jgi:hypothetical protein
VITLLRNLVRKTNHMNRIDKSGCACRTHIYRDVVRVLAQAMNRIQLGDFLLAIPSKAPTLRTPQESHGRSHANDAAFSTFIR